MPILQRIRTRLWPIIGLELEPDFPEGEVDLGTDLPLSLSLLAARSPAGTILVRATSAGALITTTTPPVHTHYEQVAGTADSSFSALNTYTWPTPRAHFTFQGTGADCIIQMQLQPGVWGGDLELKDGDVIDYSLQIYGFRVKANEEGQTSYYLITLW